MRRWVALLVALGLGAMTMQSSAAVQETSDDLPGPPPEPNGVTIALTRFDVNDAAFELHYTITNNSEDDVWLCDNLYVGGPSPSELFWDEGQTLVLRRRFSVNTNVMVFAPPTGRYVRLGSGETRPESISFSLPAGPQVVYADDVPTPGRIQLRRFAIEIGYYREDLPGLVRAILLAAARFHPAGDTLDGAIVASYFSGLLVEGPMGGLEGFEASNRNADLSKEVFISYTFGALKGEQCARLVVDGVAIPYEYDSTPH